MKKTAKKNYISKFYSLERKDLSPFVYSKLLLCPVTNCETERSFYKLIKLLAWKKILIKKY